jgi:very-short-patch-repair endonuclease
LHPVHRGVYLVGHAVPPLLARQMAAILACGPASAVSHRWAGSMWRLLPEQSSSARVDVTVAGGSGERPGIRLHRVKALDPKDRRILHRIPLTSPARTLLDLGGELPRAQLEQAVAEARGRNIVRLSQLVDVLERHPRRNGAGPLRHLLAAGEPAFTRSRAERKLLALVRAAGLPPPETNVQLGPYEVDFYWREQRLVVEVDGYSFHSSREKFESDRRRDADLQASGLRTMRVTREQLLHEADGVINRLEQALSQRT